MSKLERLRISGIRSFGPDEYDAQEIKFRTPLVLILGQNGCGKTTIIESLKFAITGELPSGSKSGQGFLYDPNMHNAHETRGQIKLKIRNVLGENITVQKFMSVTKKTNRLEFKKLNSLINKGSDPQINRKFHEVDQQMCEALGVSKAILNNVIFCHQDDSNWPLGEPRKVKEHFDEIFDATNYNKCHASILKLKKTESDKLNLLKIEVDLLNERKKEVYSMEEDLEEKVEKLETFKNTIGELREKIKSMEKQVRHIENIEINFMKLYSEIESRKNDLKNLEERKRELQQEILEEFTGTDAELEEKISKFKSNLRDIISEKTNSGNDLTDIENLESNLHEDINKNQRILGILQAEQTQYEKHKSQMVKHIISITEELCLDASISDLTSNELPKHIENIRRKIDEMNEVFVDLERQHDDSDKNLETTVNECRDEFTKLNEKIGLQKQRHKDLQTELEDIDVKINDISSCNEQLSFLETEIERLDRECNFIQSNCDVNSLKETIEVEKTKYDKLFGEVSKINSEIQMLQSYCSVQTELDLKNDLLLKLERDLCDIKNKHKKSLKKIFPQSIPSDSMLKSSLESFHKTHTVSVKKYNAELIKTQKESTKIETNLHVLKDKLKSIENDIEHSKNQLQTNCDGETYDSSIAEVKKTIEKLQKDKGTYSSSKYLFQKFIEQFEKDDPCCPLCKTKFEEKLTVKGILNDLNAKIQDFPAKLQETEEKLSKQNEKYQKLLELRPVHDKINQLNQEIPTLQTEITDLQKEFDMKKSEVIQLRTSLNVSQENLELVNNLTSDVSLIDKLHKDQLKYQSDVNDLSSKIPKKYALRNLKEALAQQETLNAEYNTVRNNIDALRNKLTQHNEQLQNFKDQHNDIANKQLKIQTKLQNRDQLIIKREETKQKLSTLTDELNELTSSIEPAKQKLQELIKQKSVKKKENRNELDESRNKLGNLQKEFDQIKVLECSVDVFEAGETVFKISQIGKTLENCKKQLEEQSEQKIIIANNFNEIEKQIANSINRFRDLQDNVQLREKIKATEIINVELTNLKSILGEADIVKQRSEKEKLKREVSKLITEKNRIEGKMTELKDIVADLKDKLAHPNNVSVPMDYKRKFVELLVKTKAVDDLANFAKALEWSILQFHKQRMVQINTIIRELWRTIYQGNDCDYIEIKTEMGDSGSFDRRRVYNYYVVQVKNDIELEMRGRCSAGQKVLASLIIRIALAETFSNNCGILALDEPTANLDRENILSLSQALVEIIVQKRQTKNFQMLIITHDEEFLSNVTQAGGLYTFYIVSRNAEGKSQIKEKKN